MSGQDYLNLPSGAKGAPTLAAPITPDQLPRPQRRPARGYSPWLLSPSIIDGAEEDREKYSLHSFLLCRRRRAEPAKIVRRARPSGGGGTRRVMEHDSCISPQAYDRSKQYDIPRHTLRPSLSSPARSSLSTAPQRLRVTAFPEPR